jgi:hypothetical protein
VPQQTLSITFPETQAAVQGESLHSRHKRLLALPLCYMVAVQHIVDCVSINMIAGRHAEYNPCCA